MKDPDDDIDPDTDLVEPDPDENEDGIDFPEFELSVGECNRSEAMEYH